MARKSASTSTSRKKSTKPSPEEQKPARPRSQKSSETLPTSTDSLHDLVDVSDLLIPQKEIFCREYITHWNVGVALEKAGLPPTARKEVLNDEQIEARVRELIKLRCDRLQIDGDVVVLALMDTHKKALAKNDFQAAVQALKEVREHIQSVSRSTAATGAAKASGGTTIIFGANLGPGLTPKEAAQEVVIEVDETVGPQTFNVEQE